MQEPYLAFDKKYDRKKNMQFLSLVRKTVRFLHFWGHKSHGRKGWKGIKKYIS